MLESFHSSDVSPQTLFICLSNDILFHMLSFQHKTKNYSIHFSIIIWKNLQRKFTSTRAQFVLLWVQLLLCTNCAFVTSKICQVNGKVTTQNIQRKRYLIKIYERLYGLMFRNRLQSHTSSEHMDPDVTCFKTVETAKNLVKRKQKKFAVWVFVFQPSNWDVPG
jgi:hypothetical protein